MDLDEVGQRAREILEARKACIEEGRLGNRHWFVALMQDAEDSLRREASWKARTAVQ